MAQACICGFRKDAPAPLIVPDGNSLVVIAAGAVVVIREGVVLIAGVWSASPRKIPDSPKAITKAIATTITADITRRFLSLMFSAPISGGFFM